jgi:hypothetical protein
MKEKLFGSLDEFVADIPDGAPWRAPQKIPETSFV